MKGYDTCIVLDRLKNGMNIFSGNERIFSSLSQNSQNSQENTQEGIGGGADISLNSVNDGTIKAKQDFENKTQMELKLYL